MTEIPANATDLSGLEGVMGNNLPRTQLGGMGSAICPAGVPDEYFLLPDRGPGNGGVAYQCRFHKIKLPVPQGGPGEFKVLSTTMLVDAAGKNYVGNSGAYDPTGKTPEQRFDPEGIAFAGGKVFVSDEYGPHVRVFGLDGKLQKEFKVPARFLVDHPDGEEELELPPHNLKGRQANKGMEGLTLTSDGKKLLGIMQSPLIQDGALDKKNKRIGENVRILEITLETGATREFVYPLESPSLAISEIMAVDDHRYLVIERDSKAGAQTKGKLITLIDTNGATDVSGVETLPTHGLPETIKPVGKRTFIDMLDPKFKLSLDQMPEKVEGLAWGPTQKDGTRVLVVTSDNDFRTDQPSYVWFFGIAAADLAK